MSTGKILSIRVVVAVLLCAEFAFLSGNFASRAQISCGSHRCQVYSDLQGNRCFTAVWFDD